MYTLCLAVGGAIVGCLMDIFGRRSFFVYGAGIGMIGAIVCATAKNILVAIGGQTLVGGSSAISFAYPFAIAELVPMRYVLLTSGSGVVIELRLRLLQIPFHGYGGHVFVYSCYGQCFPILSLTYLFNQLILV